MSTKVILQQLAELKRNPIKGANLQPLDNNINVLYGNIAGGEDTPFKDIVFHFTLELPDDYPNSAPKGFFDTHLGYHGGATYRDDKGRLVLCLNIFGNFGHVHTEWKNQSSGWSPSYTLSTILITLQGLLLDFKKDKSGNWVSDMLSTNPGDVAKTIKESKEFKCKLTGHDGSDRNKWFPLIMNDDDFVEQMSKLSLETKYDIYDDFYLCFVTKTSYKKGAVLGYPVNIENPKNGALSSPCEYLSLEAFNTGTRRSSTNKPFTNWLPLVIQQSDWPKVKEMFNKNVNLIATAINFTEPFPGKVLKIFSSLMNQLVVEIMNNKNNLTANDKFINGYFALYRLMMCCALENDAVVKLADTHLKNFVVNENQRSKQSVPNLGELLVYLTISQKFSWNDIAQFFVNECDARNVFWYAIGNHNNPAKCPELKNPAMVNGRAQKVFTATETSRNLVMFQVKFAQVANGLTMEIMESNHGLAPEPIRLELKDVYNKITGIKTWNEYFAWLGLPQISDEQRSKQLVAALETSRKAGYHK